MRIKIFDKMPSLCPLAVWDFDMTINQNVKIGRKMWNQPSRFHTVWPAAATDVHKIYKMVAKHICKDYLCE